MFFLGGLLLIDKNYAIINIHVSHIDMLLLQSSFVYFLYVIVLLPNYVLVHGHE